MTRAKISARPLFVKCFTGQVFVHILHTTTMTTTRRKLFEHFISIYGHSVDILIKGSTIIFYVFTSARPPREMLTPEPERPREARVSTPPEGTSRC